MRIQVAAFQLLESVECLNHKQGHTIVTGLMVAIKSGEFYI